jgi:hypothetical protein
MIVGPGSPGATAFLIVITDCNINYVAGALEEQY